MARFIFVEIHRKVQDIFSILLPAADAVCIFGEKHKIYCIMEVPQAHLRQHLILNLLTKPDKGTPSINNTTNRDVALESMQFGRDSSCILQAIWEADPAKGPVRISKLDVTNAYHHGNLWPSQVGAFAYVAPSTPEDGGVII